MAVADAPTFSIIPLPSVYINRFSLGEKASIKFLWANSASFFDGLITVGGGIHHGGAVYGIICSRFESEDLVLFCRRFMELQAGYSGLFFPAVRQ